LPQRKRKTKLNTMTLSARRKQSARRT
jgi:hypothetical protein